MPVTTPPATIALVLLLLQVPPETVSVSVIDEPVHTLEGPVMIPELDGKTVTVTIALQPAGNA
jgi:hypothetical protein